MRSKSVDELLQAFQEITSPIPGGLKLGPVIDGWVLPDDPAALFAAGRQRAVPLLVGTNADEGTVFAPQVTLQQYRALAAVVYGDLAGQVLALFPAGSDQEARESLTRLITELGFAAQARFAAECVSASGQDAYLYQFTWKLDNPLTRDLGSFHGLELPYVFGNMGMFTRFGLDPGEADLALSDAMMDYWVSFARDGVPSSQGRPAWPPYQPSQDRYQVLGGTIENGSGLYREACDLGETMLRGE
jgi:para-nitrobenzyl esterase